MHISLVDSFTVIEKPNNDIFNFHVIPFENGILVEYIESRSGCKVKISDSLLYFNLENQQQSFLFTPKCFHHYSQFNIMDFSSFLTTQNYKLVRYRAIGRILKHINIIGTRSELGTYKIENDTLKIRPLKKSIWAKNFYEWNNQEIIVKFSYDDRFIYKSCINANYKLKFKKFIDLKKIFPEINTKESIYFNYIKNKNLIVINYANNLQFFCYNLENNESFKIDNIKIESDSSKNLKFFYTELKFTHSLKADWYYQFAINSNFTQTKVLLWKNDLNHHYDAMYNFSDEYPLFMKEDMLYTYCYKNGKLIVKSYSLF